MSYCKSCGAEIDWMRTEEGRYIPVDPEPVFVIENDGQERFYDEELGELIGRQAKPEEVRTGEQKMSAALGFVPHWRTCGKKQQRAVKR